MLVRIIIIIIVTCMGAWLLNGFWNGRLNLSAPYTDNSELQAITALSLNYTLYSSPLHTHYCSQSSLVVSWQRIYNSLTVTAAHIKSSWHSVIPFVPFLLNHLRLPSPELGPVLLAASDPRYVASRRTQRITPLLNNSSVVVRVFVPAGMCLPSSCLAIDVFSHFTIPAFGAHVTLLLASGLLSSHVNKHELSRV
jgi:hypothetical protein